MSQHCAAQPFQDSCIIGLFFVEFLEERKRFHVEAQLGKFNGSFPPAVVAVVCLRPDRRCCEKQSAKDKRDPTPPSLSQNSAGPSFSRHRSPLLFNTVAVDTTRT